MRLGLVLVLGFLVCSKSFALTGNELLDTCSTYVKNTDLSAMNTSDAICLGYISGFMDQFYVGLAAYVNLSCFSNAHKNIINDQIVRIVLKYLQNNPEKTNQFTPFLISAAFFEAFPIPKDCYYSNNTKPSKK